MKKSALLLLIVLAMSGVHLHRAGCIIVDLRPKATRLTNEIIDPSKIPFQENLLPSLQNSFQKKVKGHIAKLTPKAHFKIAGRVVSKRHYYKSWEASLSPLDLALAWGQMASPKYDEFLSYRHGDRYYSYSYSGSFPLDPNTVANNSANEHLIPANRHIEKTLKSIKTGEVVELEGMLVDVEGNGNEPSTVRFKTSLTRDDKGAGACEVVYVTKVQIGQEVFE